MTEGLFILTTIFVAYVVYQVVNDKKATPKPVASAAEPEKKAANVAPAKPQAAAKTAAPIVAETVAAVAAENPAVSAEPESAGRGGLRDPKTGEVASTATNYRFTKRWIKDALVAEGLLDKVYKNNELDAAAEAKIKTALAKLEAMDKYRA